MAPRASVIIPTYQSWAELQVCLDHLSQQSLPAPEFEVIVVNNAVTDDRPSDLRLPTNARVLHEPRPGSYAARNAGVAAARGEVFFFTDADCRPAPDYLTAGLACLDRHPHLGRFAGAITLFAAADHWTAAEIYDRVTSLRQEKYAARGDAATANLFVRREVFDAVGPFDAERLSGGDFEWNQRAGAAGYPLHYASDVVVGHPARASFAAHATKARRLLGAKFKRLQGGKRILFYVPPVRKILPQPAIFLRMLKDPDIAPGQAFAVWGLHYRIQMMSIVEQIRLAWFKGAHERR